MNALISPDEATMLSLLALVIFGALLAAAVASALRKQDRKILQYISIHAAPKPRYTFPAWIDPARDEKIRASFLAAGIDTEDAARGMLLSVGEKS